MASRPSTSRGSHDPLLKAFLADHATKMPISHIAVKHGTYRERVLRALNSQRDVETRRQRFRPDIAEGMARLAAKASAAVEEIRESRVSPAPRLAAGTSAAIHALRARVRIFGPAPADDTRIAAAHAAGLTLDDIHEVFAVPPAEAARASAAHAGR